MIDQRHRTEAPRRALHLPVPAAAARALVLGAVFVCAACGLVYELELVALASYLVGDSVTQASVILSVMVFAMGCGSLLAKRLRGRAAAAFAAVETGLALVGGLSVMVLYGFFAWFGQTVPAMVGCAFAIGVLTGAEVPLLMTLVQRIRRQDAGGAVADLFAADYVGALVGGLAFPFLLLPHFGQLTGALATGVVNAAAGGATVLWLFRGDLSRRARGWLLVANVLVLALLACAAAAAGPFERAAQRAVYGGDVRVAEQSAVQEIVLAGGGSPANPLRLYLDGRLRVSGTATARYAQALVHPAMNGTHARVLVLGGGDGLALREVLRYADVTAVTAVQPDVQLLRLARTDPGLAALNGHAYADPRVRALTADPFDWLRGLGRSGAGAYDVIVADLADPGELRNAKLYSQEFYGLAARALAPGGRLAVQAGTATGAARTFWTIDATVCAAGLHASPYWLPGDPAGTPDQAYLLAARSGAPPLTLPRAPRRPSPGRPCGWPPGRRCPPGPAAPCPPRHCLGRAYRRRERVAGRAAPATLVPRATGGRGPCPGLRHPGGRSRSCPGVRWRFRAGRPSCSCPGPAVRRGASAAAPMPLDSVTAAAAPTRDFCVVEEVPAFGAFAIVPAGMPSHAAAALPTAGMTALGALDHMRVREGGTLLVIGATGGVGTFAVQAAARGIRVVATASARHAEQIRGLGAGEVAVRDAEPLEESLRKLAPEGVDAILDVVGDPAVTSRVAGAVRDGGALLSTVFGLDERLLADARIRTVNYRLDCKPERLAVHLPVLPFCGISGHQGRGGLLEKVGVGRTPWWRGGG